MDIFGLHIPTGVMVMLVVFSVPLTWILSDFYLSLQKLKLEKGKSLSREDIQLLKKTLQKNEELEERVKALESIVTSLESDEKLLKEGK